MAIDNSRYEGVDSRFIYQLYRRLEVARSEQDDATDSKGYEYWKGAGDSLQALIDFDRDASK